MAVEEKASSQFKVEFTKDAKEFIEDKEFDNITIKMVRQSGGWSGPTMRPEVQAGNPKGKERDNYQMLEVDGVNVHIANNMNRENKNIKLTIDVTGFWVVKNLYLSKAEQF